ncbi:penicillin-binding protein 2 [Microlunatus sp. Gsoil 973]|uniref:peptidoglycan D,D-transpeptidase FtsI family protein n=1 Tax=Microlunatus sp. Gsoil 973 TaxID=2672569 RepID=UPI0012B47536|nr:penicillin-binding protein 2 [Microlunatus sp. Gsoil 973]QGN31916.1 penicillin-binding protein 2 [Microlunatus sp. Gsoil 973]
MGERRQHPSKRNASTTARTSSRQLRTPRTTPAAAPRPTTGRPKINTTKINKTKINKTKITKAKITKTGKARRHGVRKTLIVPLGSGTRRVRIIGIAMAIAISLCAGRLLQLQGFDSAAYGAIATASLTTTTPLLPARGEITGRDGTVLAGTQPAVDITADPTLTSQDCSETYVGDLCGLAQATKITQVIASHIKIDQPKTIATLMRHDTHFVYVAKKVPADVYTDIANQLDSDNLPGIYRENDPIRTYPNGPIASNIVGFVNGENEGRAGLEYSLNSSLAGVEGKESYESAPNGSKIPLGDSSITPAKNGTNYQLTIDPELQWMMQRRIDSQRARTGADWITAITMDVTTGEVLAMAQTPGYDSSDPGASKPSNLGDRAVSQAYEPGSVEKVLTSAALIDSGAANPETKVVVPPTIASGDGRIKDAEGHGTVHYTMRGIIANSSNIGTLMLTRQMDKTTLRNYLSSFGLGRTTGVELPGESAGSLPTADMKDYTRDQIAFGQGLSVTTLQEATAISAIVNGGIYHTPTVIKSASTADGTAVPIDRPAPRRVISAKTSAEVRDMMEAVVTHTAVSQKYLMLSHYRSGGKTGTAQRYDPKCGCYRGYVTSFVGFAPLDNPRLLTYVVVNNPKRGDSGTGTAGPVYRDIMQYALPRYGIVPDQKNKAWGARQMDRPLTW